MSLVASPHEDFLLLWPMPEGAQDRFSVTGMRAPAAVEWRTIPPTIDVRYKRRPPPLTLLARRASDVSAISPGPLDTSTTASSFTSFATSVTSPRSAGSQLEFSHTPIPTHTDQYSALSPRRSVASIRSLLSATSLDFIPADSRSTFPVSQSVATSTVPDLETPEDPIRYLQEHPWDFAEYLHLLSLVAERRPSGGADWEDLASVHSRVSSIYRSAWDCWHRWTVPWSANSAHGALTYPDVPGVKHRYHHIDIDALVDFYVLLTTYAGVADSIPSSEPELVNSSITRRHPAYPGPHDPPNVPKRTLGDSAHRGILPWFRATAVNATVLQMRQDLRGAEPNTPPGERLLPRHLRELRVPQRAVRGDG
ncbi:hypothetical protein K488DRAFT_89533 [Vararia minispora EC-137]|uniref:Uncharacterized protein n=1 Tax=Vararia minispora EC-137 TaxID=1314806 RepID=A0ACB8QAB2_9AGAM|nr:hypothetical protein K488DRAFT_89533 [Vararia minispora EC-137]